MVAVDLNDEGAPRAVDQVTADGGRAVAVAADATDPDRMKAAVETAVSRFGALHPALDHAGISGPLGPVTEIDIEGYQRLMDIHLNAVFYGMYCEIPAIIDAEVARSSTPPRSWASWGTPVRSRTWPRSTGSPG